MTVLLFAGLRDLAGSETLNVDVPDGTTVGELRTRIELHFPNLASLASRSRIAVNCEFAESSRIILITDEVALIPPVSGG